MAAETRRAFKERMQWIEALAKVPNAELDPAAKLVGIVLANYRNDHTGECYPSIAALVSSTGLSESTVRRAIYKKLRKLGWITFPDNPGGKGKSTQYTLTKPCHSRDTLSTPKS